MHTFHQALILGYGRSGKAAERLLTSEGCRTDVLAEESADELDLAKQLAAEKYEVCIVSPGFALSHPWVSAVRAAGIPLLSELELGWSRHKGKTVAVTGSNGKSTAVKWIHETLELAGLKSALGGNYGIPASEAVMKHPDSDWLVLEVSSFQLETVQEFRPDISILLNILPNHLDRHGSMEEYRRTKARVFGPAEAGSETCIVPASLVHTLKAALPDERKRVTFGTETDADFRYDSGRIFQGTTSILNLCGTPFDSPVIGGCTGAAMAAFLSVSGISFDLARQSAERYNPLPHRQQRLGELDGVVYINDSKATNLAAMAAALEAAGGHIHLIAGGLPKESDYTFVKEILAERVRSIYVIGQASRAMYEAWNGVCLCVECGTLNEAFNRAREASRAGDTVLLSPGCASFDQFNGFEDRGEQFEELFRGAEGRRV